MLSDQHPRMESVAENTQHKGSITVAVLKTLVGLYGYDLRGMLVSPILLCFPTWFLVAFHVVIQITRLADSTHNMPDRKEKRKGTSLSSYPSISTM